MSDQKKKKKQVPSNHWSLYIATVTGPELFFCFPRDLQIKKHEGSEIWFFKSTIFPYPPGKFLEPECTRMLNRLAL